MAFDLTKLSRLKTEQISQELNMILEIDGIPTRYGANIIKKYIRIGDAGLVIGDTWTIGGLSELEDQNDLISFNGTTSSIQQQLNPDKGIGSSVSSLDIQLIDLNGEITKLMTPGLLVDDILARRAKIYLGYKNTSFPEDYVDLFRGVISDVLSQQGTVKFTVDCPDQKKRQDLFEKVEGALNGAITNSDTTITLQSTARMLQKVLGPDGLYDSTFGSYVVIDSEIIKYDTILGNQLIGCVRGQLGTVATSHSNGATTNTFYRIQGSVIDLALKLMLSGGPQVSYDVDNFVNIGPIDSVDNSIFFFAKDIKRDLGIVKGDYCTSTGAINPSNNFTLKQINDIVYTNNGCYLVINGVTLVSEFSSTATITFRSKYDTLPDGAQMYMDEVDVDQHETIKRLFLSNFLMDHYIKDTIICKDFIEKELYLPCAAYSVPRKAKSSVGFHSAPIPNSNIKILNDKNVKNASKIAIRRSTGKNFYNTIVTKYEFGSFEDKFYSGTYTENATSKGRILTGPKSLIIESKGFRESTNGAQRSIQANNRLLKRYAFGAEWIDSLECTFADGFNIEIGDIVLLNATKLNISDIESGKRGTLTRLFEVINKSIDIKTGQVKLNLVDTNFEKDSRYGLISPSSYVRSATDQKTFIIKPSFNTDRYGTDEYLKWKKYVGAKIKIRSQDWTVVGESFIESVSSNNIKLTTDIGFTILPDYIMEFANYSADQIDAVKLVYAYMKDVPFVDGPQYKML